MKAATVPATPPAAAAAARRVTLIQKATARSRAKREGRRSTKTPVGITAPRLSRKSRVTGPPLGGAGHRRGPKRSPEITDRRGQAGAGDAARARRSDPRETREGGTAGTGRGPAALKPQQTDAGAARQAGRRGAGAGVAAETLRGPEVTQTEGAAAGRGEERERPGEGAGAGRGGIEAQSELTGDTDPFGSLWSVSDVSAQSDTSLSTAADPRGSARGQQWTENIDIAAALGK